MFDTILGLPLVGELIASAIAGFVALQVRGFLHRTTLVVNKRGKKSFDVLPSWVKAFVYKALLEVKALFPMAKQEEILDRVCAMLKLSIKGKLDDIVIDAIRGELSRYINEISGVPIETTVATVTTQPAEPSTTPSLDIDMTKEI